jgi:hypothetical protein
MTPVYTKRACACVVEKVTKRGCGFKYSVNIPYKKMPCMRKVRLKRYVGEKKNDEK